MNPLDFIDPALDYITSLKGQKLVIVFLIAIGYMIKMVPKIPNQIIPFVNCIIVGPLLTLVLIGWPSAGDMDPNLKFPEVAAWLHAYAKGLLLAVLAWVAHGMVLRRLIDSKVAAWAAPEKQAASPVPIAPAATVMIVAGLILFATGCSLSIGKAGLKATPIVPPANAVVRLTARSIGITAAQNPATQTPELTIGYRSVTYDRIPTSAGTNVFVAPVNASIGVGAEGITETIDTK